MANSVAVGVDLKAKAVNAWFAALQLLTSPHGPLRRYIDEAAIQQAFRPPGEIAKVRFESASAMLPVMGFFGCRDDFTILFRIAGSPMRLAIAFEIELQGLHVQRLRDALFDLLVKAFLASPLNHGAEQDIGVG